MTDYLFDPKVWVALLAIVTMEAVLGVDNLVYLALLTDQQPEPFRNIAERIGLGVAIAARLVLVILVVEVMDWITPIVTILGQALSWRDILLVAGGLVLMVKGTQEIYAVVEGPSDRLDESPAIDGEQIPALDKLGVAQMVLIDLAFATDSIASAFALNPNGWVVVCGLILGMATLFFLAGPLSALFTRHPSVRVLIFSFMLILGLCLISDGLGYAIPKGYLYFTLGLAASVEALELIFHRKG